MFKSTFSSSRFEPAPNRILFEVPDHESLSATNTVMDLHFHSCYSDGADPPEKIAEKARSLGIGIAITDHNAIDGALAIDRYKNLLSIPGIEVTSKQGAHVLVYFYEARALQFFFEKEIEPFLGRDRMSSIGLSMEEIVRRAGVYEALVIFPHPYCAMYTGICNPIFSPERQRDLLAMADGVEVINAGNVKKWNLKCALLGFNLNKAITGGSDGHSIEQMGKSVTYAPVAADRIAFLEALRKGENRVIGKELNLVRKVAANGVKVPSSIDHSSNIMEKNMRYGYAVLNKKTRQVKVNMRRRLNNRRLRKSAFS